MMALPAPTHGVAVPSRKRPPVGSSDAPAKKQRWEVPDTAFDCPICCEAMTGQIFQCKEGHPICGDCLKKTKASTKLCPSCRSRFPCHDMRNRALEQLAENCLFECRWRCGASLRPPSMAKHLSSCVRRAVKCPVPTCGHLVPLQEMLQHIASPLHQKDVIKHSGAGRPINVRTSFSEDFEYKKVHLVSDTCLIHVRIKNNMMSITFSHFHTCVKYHLTLTGKDDHVCVFTGRSRAIDQTTGGTTIYIPKQLGLAFLTKSANGELRFPLVVSFNNVEVILI